MRALILTVLCVLTGPAFAIKDGFGGIVPGSKTYASVAVMDFSEPDTLADWSRVTTLRNQIVHVWLEKPDERLSKSRLMVTIDGPRQPATTYILTAERLARAGLSLRDFIKLAGDPKQALGLWVTNDSPFGEIKDLAIRNRCGFELSFAPLDQSI